MVASDFAPRNPALTADYDSVIHSSHDAFKKMMPGSDSLF